MHSFSPGNGDNTDFTRLQGKTVIIGAGLAGLFTALKLAPLPVTVISPTPLGKGASSFWAQGGIAAAIGEGDHPDKHVLDTINVGGGIVDKTIATLVANEASQRIEDLLSYGVPFDKNIEGKLTLSREAAHSERRIVRVKGDMAGQAIMECLITAVRNTPSIQVLEGFRVSRLITHENNVRGIFLSPYTRPDTEKVITSPNVILATGGVGGLYAVTTNPSTSSGEGIAMAAKAGAVIADPEFVQFHPTAINIGIDPAPLATEALRGEGATLIDKNNHRFMLEVHSDAELAPRDIVARAVHQHVIDGNGAFLDCRQAIGKLFPERYPTVYAKCKQAGIDPVTMPIPVAPAAHYHMGGVLTDENGKTTLNGLWACGETASTGMHGANRLASNSLLEAVVFAARIAENIKAESSEKTFLSPVLSDEQTEITNNDNNLIQNLRADMSRYLGVIRNQKDIEALIDNLHSAKDRPHSSHISNMLIVTEMMANAALQRKESRGGHSRSDYPDLRTEYAHRSYWQLCPSSGKIKQISPPLPNQQPLYSNCK